MAVKQKRLIGAVLIAVLTICFFTVFLVPNANAVIVVPTTTYLNMPAYGTNINFIAEQTFNDLWRESSTNPSYPEYWFFITSGGYTFGLQSQAVNFTVSNVFTSSTLTYNQSAAGIVHVYCGVWGEPSSYNSSYMTYDAVSMVATCFYSSAGTITLSWTSVPPTTAPTATPTPTPTATATPTPTLTLSITQPFNRTYVTTDIPLELAYTGVGVSVWYNIMNGSSYVYGVNQTYSGLVTLSGFSDSSYVLYAWATSGSGEVASASVMFTVDNLYPEPVLPQVDTDYLWLFFFEGDFLGALQAYLVATFLNFETAIVAILMLFIIPLYLRTKSLMLISIIWILVGGFFVAAVPAASGLSVIFIVMGIGGLLYRLFRPGYGS